MSNILTSILLFKIGLLPLVIFASTLFITIKISHLYHHLTTHSSLQFNTSPLYAAPTSPTEQVKQPTSDSKSNKDAQVSSDFDPLNLTAEEFKVLNDMAQSQTSAKKAANAYLHEEANLIAIEKRLDDKIAQLTAIKTKLESVVQSIDEQENVNIKRIIKMCESMKAPEAAKRLEGIEFDTLIEVMEKMNEKKASAILAIMEPDKASYLLTTLAKRKKVFKKDAPDQSVMAG